MEVLDHIGHVGIFPWILGLKKMVGTSNQSVPVAWPLMINPLPNQFLCPGAESIPSKLVSFDHRHLPHLMTSKGAFGGSKMHSNPPKRCQRVGNLENIIEETSSITSSKHCSILLGVIRCEIDVFQPLEILQLLVFMESHLSISDPRWKWVAARMFRDSGSVTRRY